MPIYEYRCSCGKTFEAVNSIEKRAHADCPVCGVPCNTELLVSVPAVAVVKSGTNAQREG